MKGDASLFRRESFRSFIHGNRHGHLTVHMPTCTLHGGDELAHTGATAHTATKDKVEKASCDRPIEFHFNTSAPGGSEEVASARYEYLRSQVRVCLEWS